MIDLLVQLGVRELHKLLVQQSIVTALVQLNSEQLGPDDFAQLVLDLLPAEQRVEDAHPAVIEEVLALQADQNEELLRDWLAKVVVARRRPWLTRLHDHLLRLRKTFFPLKRV